MQNLGPDIAYEDLNETGPLPRTIRFGLAHNISTKDLFHNNNVNSGIRRIFLEQSNLNIALDFFKRLSWRQEFAFTVGCEFTPISLLSLRLGYFYPVKYNDAYYYYRKTGITYGIGLKIKGFHFDIGNDGNTYYFDTSNWRFSVSYMF
jgi:hypothetical protein